MKLAGFSDVFQLDIDVNNLVSHCSICPKRLATKVTIAGGALYVACDSGLLGSGEQGSEALGRAKAVVPPAVEEWMKYFGLEVQISQT